MRFNISRDRHKFASQLDLKSGILPLRELYCFKSSTFAVEPFEKARVIKCLPQCIISVTRLFAKEKIHSNPRGADGK
jgi:hypothetical protein